MTSQKGFSNFYKKSISIDNYYPSKKIQMINTVTNKKLQLENKFPSEVLICSSTGDA